MTKHLAKMATLSLFMGFLTACDTAQEPNEPQTRVEATPYQAPDPGFVKNPGFAPDGKGGLAPWRLQQHASNTSYTLSLEAQGVAIERTGTEPWGKLSQRFTREDIKPLLGKTLEFSADMKGVFTDEYGEPMEPPALTVLAKGLRKGEPAMMGSSVILSEKAQMKPVAGEQDWQRYSVTFELPSAQAVRGTQLEVGFVLTMGGKLIVRGPSLKVVSNSE